MATIDETMPLITFVCYVGGTSGQQIINTLQESKAFARYDSIDISDTGARYRFPYWPFTEKQYLTRLPRQDITDISPGPTQFIQTEENRQWLRAQSWDYFTKRWNDSAVLDLDEVVAEKQQLLFHTHLDNNLLNWMLPEARKLFMLTKNSYFGVRADAVKNSEKHPTEPDKLLRYITQRTAYHVHWSREVGFNYTNSKTFYWSDLITDDKIAHDRCLADIMEWYSITMDQQELASAWKGTCEYVSVQRQLGFLF